MKNIRLLRKVAHKILMEPKQFEIGQWFRTSESVIPNCGTAACLGGWVVALRSKKKPKTIAFKHSPVGSVGGEYHEIGKQAASLLGLSKSQQNRLFIYENWPNQFKRGSCYARVFDAPENAYERAVVTYQRIEHFIKTRGKE